MRLIQKNENIIQKLRSLNLDFNSLFILESLYHDESPIEGYKIPSFEDFHMSQCVQQLKSEEYIIENPDDSLKTMISVKGRNLYELLVFYIEKSLANQGYATVVIKAGLTDDEKFEEWWKTYPSSNAWTTDDKLQKFIGSRTLKNLRKDEAKKRYLKLLNQGLKHEELVGGLKYELKLKKLDSIKKNSNQLEFFKGMESYFNQARYLTYIEDYKNNPKFVDESTVIKKQNVTDI